MFIGIAKYQKFGILIIVVIFINGKAFAFEQLNEEKFHNTSRTRDCDALCQNLNFNKVKNYLLYLKNIINTTEQTPKKCVLILNESNGSLSVKANELRKISDLKIDFVDFPKSNNLMQSTAENTVIILSTTERRNLLNLINNTNRILRKFQKACGSLKVCHGTKRTPSQNSFPCPEVTWQAEFKPKSKIMKTAAEIKTKKFSISNEEPEYINISVSDVNIEGTFLLYGSYANVTSPHFECIKIVQKNFTVYVTPNVNYLICLAKVDKCFLADISDCQPFRTKPLHENQPWLAKKSIPVFIISVFVIFIFAMAAGASVLYLSVHKNPSLIRGSKRVIEVKRHDKAQILIMPRGYESLPQADNSLALPCEPATSNLSCDTISTVSYVSANQPTPIEILTYRLNRLRELFRRNNNNPLVSSIPMPLSVALNERLPPNVDLLLEYEWYTITKTITTTTEEA